MSSEEDLPSRETHLFHLRLALSEAIKCTPTDKAFNVGALLVDPSASPPTLITTGYSRELPGNTHAEQCCLEKLQDSNHVPALPDECSLYTTMEPCSKRLSGEKSCVERIIEFGKIKTVYVGAVEPDTFVANNTSRQALEEQGIKYIHVPGMDEECLEVARRGH